MKKFTLSIIIFFLTITNSFTHVNHYDKFNSLEYNLYRNNKLIGSHIYNFERKADSFKVNSVVNFKITKLGVDLYKYHAVSEETYKDGKLLNFISKTKQNKKDRFVNINFIKEKDNFFIDGSSYKGSASKDFIVGTWWNHEIVKSKAQISAVSGRIIEQKVTFLGKEKITIDGKEFNALHFNFASSNPNLPKEKKLNTDIWYDENNFLWLKAAFDKTGYWEYRLKSSN